MAIVRVRLFVTGVACPAGAHGEADATFNYTIANPRVGGVNIKLYHNRLRMLTLGAHGAEPYQQGHLGYRMRDLISGQTSAVKNSKDAGKLTASVSFRIAYYKFFKRVLEQASRTDNKAHNFASPDNTGVENEIKAAITRTATTINPEDTDWNITFHAGAVSLTDHPARVAGVTRSGNGNLLLNLRIHLGGGTLSDKQASHILQALIAADQTALYREQPQDTASAWYGSNPDHSDEEEQYEVWEKNILHYMINSMELARGRKFLNYARDQGLQESQIARNDMGITRVQRQMRVIKQVRNEIDRILITANPWGEPTNQNAPYAGEMHTVLAVAYDHCFRAMPVRFLRSFEIAGITVDDDDASALACQLGMGNCGEHSDVSYRVLKAMMGGSPETASLINLAIQSGYSNIDHAFTVGGIRPYRIVKALVGRANHASGVGIGERAETWSARDAAQHGGGEKGWICDPYLASGQIARTLEELGQGQVIRRWLDWLDIIHPALTAPIPTLNRDDVRGFV